MNVVVGLCIGVSVPIAGAVALSQAQPDFDPIEHLLFIIVLCLMCAAVGVVVNLPWRFQQAQSPIQSDIEAAGRFDFERDDAADGDDDSSQTENGRGPDPTFRIDRTGPSRVAALALLGLRRGASRQQIRNAYRQLAKTCHPDRHATRGDDAVQAAADKFRHLRRAYEVLISGD